LQRLRNDGLKGYAEEVDAEKAHPMGAVGSPATFVGIVYAPDEKAVLNAAIREFEITPEQQNRLLIRRA
jgi:hypothetical protein